MTSPSTGDRLDLAADLEGADQRLVVYGSLAPGQSNHHELADLRGRWLPGQIRGALVSDGWAVAIGYPAMRLDDKADAMDVQLFVSADLPGHWARLDAFEGPDYQRVPVIVETADGALTAWIYAVRDD